MISRARDGRPSVAVLPFGNLSSEEADAFFAHGIHEEVIAQLAKIGGLKVVSRTSVMGYQNPDRNIRQIAAELGRVLDAIQNQCSSRNEEQHASGNQPCALGGRDKTDQRSQKEQDLSHEEEVAPLARVVSEVRV